MYHIKADRRALTSAQLIFDALMTVLPQKPFERITVTEVLQQSTVSRATFYRNFDTLRDVLVWRYEASFENFVNQFLVILEQTPRPLPKDILLRYFFTHWYDNKEVLMALHQAKHMDIVYESFVTCSRPLTKAMLPDIDMDSLQYQYYIAARAGSVFGKCRQWVEGGMKETPKEMMRFYAKNWKLVMDKDFLF